MDTILETKSTLETTAYLHDGELKNKPCEIGHWYGSDICEKIDFNSEIEKTKIPEGEYKIVITLEKI